MTKDAMILKRDRVILELVNALAIAYDELRAEGPSDINDSVYKAAFKKAKDAGFEPDKEHDPERWDSE